MGRSPELVLAGVLAAARDLASARPPAVLDRLLAGAIELADADAGAVWMREGERLVVAASRGGAAPGVGRAIPADDGLLGTVLDSGEPAVDGLLLAAPLRLRGRAAGAVVVERGPGRPAFEALDRMTVALLAEQAALAARGSLPVEVASPEEDVGLPAPHGAGHGGARSSGPPDVSERSTLVATVVHDLKAPLSAVVGYVQLLRDRGERLDAERRRAMCDEVLTQTRRLTEMLEGLQTAAVTASGAPLDQRPVELTDLVRAAAQTASGLAHLQGVAREVAVDAPEPVVVHADAAALERVLANLVDNAVNHSPPGTALHLQVRADGDEAVVLVRDHGEGIVEDLRERVFDRFVSGGDGAGLGLYVVRSLVEAHGGRVRLHAVEGGGTLAEVRLPRSLQQAPHAS